MGFALEIARSKYTYVHTLPTIFLMGFDTTMILES